MGEITEQRQEIFSQAFSTICQTLDEQSKGPAILPNQV